MRINEEIIILQQISKKENINNQDNGHENSFSGSCSLNWFLIKYIRQS